MELAIVKMEVDPLGAFPEMDQETLQDLLGLVPHWAAMYNPVTGKSLREHVEEQYELPIGYYHGGTVQDDYTYVFPGDAAVSPLMVVVYSTGQKLILYVHGLVSFLDFDGDGVLRWYHGRVD